MVDPSQNAPGEEDEEASEQVLSGSLDVEAGLAAAFGPRSRLDSSPDRPRSFCQPGEIIADKFRLIEIIGDGGMGTVWYAEQTAPIKRKVALKLIKPGLDLRSVLARFDAERQALAMMDHPNIARVFDGGITDRGFPFFVMELVRGTSLTEFCDERRLALNERIGLFVSVCQAIQHAHQKGVIHRDIKPSNVMVALYDGRPVPKVIDFGVAKAIGPSLSDISLHTEFGAVVGTAEYMSPEQAELNNLDIDTRSDVYSLGVLMYELLSGSPPFPRGVGRKRPSRSFADHSRSRSSTSDAKLSTSKMRASIAALRSIEPDALGNLLRGDLDWIVMKSLEKDRSRRYESPHAMARDLERFLRDEPVDASPPSALYRTRKFLRRYRWQTAGTSLLLATLIAGIVGTSLGYFRAESQRRIAVKAQKAADDRAEGEHQAKRDALRQKEIAEKAEAATLESYRASTDDAIEKLIISKAALSKQERAYLDGALNRWQAFAARQGDDKRNRSIRAEAHFRVAAIWDLLGENDRAREEYDRAAELWERLGEEFPEEGQYLNESSRSRRHQATVLQKLHKFPEAEAMLRTAISRQEKLVEKFFTISKYRQELVRNANSLGALLGPMGKQEEAVSVLGQAVKLQIALVDEFPDVDEYRLSLADCHFNHALSWRRFSRSGTNEAELRLALENYERLAAKDQSVSVHRSGLARCLQELGSRLANSGNYADAEQMVRRSLATKQSLVTEFPSAPNFREELSDGHQYLGWLLCDHLRKTSDSESEYRKATELRQRLVADFPDVPTYRRGLSTSYFSLGRTLLEQGKTVEALTEYLKALKIREELADRFPLILDHKIDLWWNLFALGKLELDAGNAAESKAWFDKAIQSGRNVFDSDPQSIDALTLLQYAYRGRAKARKILNDENFQEDWDQVFQLTPDNGHPSSRLRRALILAEVEQFERMVSEIESLILLDSGTRGAHHWTHADWYEFACMFSKASESMPDRQQELADRCLEMLKKAVQAGFQDGDFLRRDKSLDAIRDREEFKQIVEELERTRNRGG